MSEDSWMKQLNEAFVRSPTLSSRKRRYSLPKEPSGRDAILVRASVESRILGLSLQKPVSHKDGIQNQLVKSGDGLTSG